MKKIITLLLVLVISLSTVTACSSDGEDTGSSSSGTVQAKGSILESDRERETVTDISMSDEEDLVNGNNEFALDMFQELKDEDGNIMFSPYSISVALAMTYAGAEGTTATEMANAMNFNLPQAQLHPAFNWLSSKINSRGEGASGIDGQPFKLNVVNALWGQKDFEFNSTFIDTLALNYGAGLRIVDYRNEPEKARVTINNWVSDQTEDLIKDLIPQGAVNTDTRLVLTNAIYFNAAWMEQFTEGATKDESFTLLDGTTVNVPTMYNNASFGYVEGSDFQAVELPYDGNEISMVILLPDEGTYEDFEANLDLNRLNNVLDGLQRKNMTLTMPKFKFESSFSLNAALSALGMPQAFTSQADFSGMTPEGYPLSISDVIHKSYIDVDENGTEAAAATAVIIGITSAPMDPITVNIDRPFMFLIRDMETNSILFLGRVLNPES